MGIVERYILQFNREKKRLRRIMAVLIVLSLLVVVSVGWNLRIPGITLANDACCGYPEHHHSDECATESILICGYPEESVMEVVLQSIAKQEEIPADSPEEESFDTEEPGLEGAETFVEETSEPPTVAYEEVLQPQHIHTDGCYGSNYLCGYEEHIHVIDCYCDLSADVEYASDWELTLPSLTDDWATNLVYVAQSQLGCMESDRNFTVAEDGQTRNGITRYGQWYGNPYGDWSSMFAMFCLNYAQVPQNAIPWSPGVQNMMRLAQEKNILTLSNDSLGTAGNILFVDTDENGNANHILIVTGSAEETLYAIGGDWENAVSEVSLSGSDSRILGCINVSAVHQALLEEQVTQPTQPEESESSMEDIQENADEPRITLSVEFPEEGILRIVAETANFDNSEFIWHWQVSDDGNEPWSDLEGAEGLVYEFADTEENANRYYRLQGHRTAQKQMTFALARTDAIIDEENGTITSDAISPFSIGKNNNIYTIDLFAIPVDSQGSRISELDATSIGTVRVNSTTKTDVEDLFDAELGLYQSAYFGSATSVAVDNIASVWRYRSGLTYYLAYAQTSGTQNQRWKNSADTSVSLYLRYTPQFTVTFESEGFAPQTETVRYGDLPTLTEPGTWSRENHSLAGWIADNNEQTVYTYEEIIKRPIVADVTYRAKWWNLVTVSYDLGTHTDALYPIVQDRVLYGGSVAQYPTPAWRINTMALVFDGWYLDEALTERAEADHLFYEDTVLYAKWLPRDDGFFVYYMDFVREGETPLVLMTSGVTEGSIAYPHTPSNAPEGMEWDGKWYLDMGCTEIYDFHIPVSQMKDKLTGANGRDLYLYPGTRAVCRSIFVTYGTKIDPVTVPLGGTINLDQYIPERPGYSFAGWVLKDGSSVSGVQVLEETTTFYATWEAGYVPFEAILRIENANDTAMTQADILGTWYAKAGSQIRVNSTYTGTGINRTGTHRVVCVLDGVEYPVYTNAAQTQQATLGDVYSTYFIFNNSGTSWTDEVNWDDVYTGGELPYGTRPISSNGDTIINFDYMRVRKDIVFTIPNGTSGGYMDVYKLYQNGLITGSVTYTGTKPTTEGKNVSATGVSSDNVRWTYTAASSNNGSNLYTLQDMKYGQRIFDVYPVGTSWLTPKNANVGFHQYSVGSNQLFASRREDLSAAFFSGSGRKLTPYSLTAQFEKQERIGLMYAVECLDGEIADFTLNGKGYKVQTQLCEVVNHTGGFGIKELTGCEAGINVLGTNDNNNYYTNLNTTNAKVGNTSVRTLFGTTYWEYYKTYVSNLTSINRAYIFCYDRQRINVHFSFAYDSDGDGINESVQYENIAYGESIADYRFGAPNLQKHPMLDREGYMFSGWLDANGNILNEEDWESLVIAADGENSAMIFIGKWEKISGNIVEYYEDISAATPFETHYFEDGALLEYPTMTVYPQGWVWQEYGEGGYQRFDWDVPMYGEYGVAEVRQINGEDRIVNVIRIYGRWDETHTRVVYDPNAAQGGILGSAPMDDNEYTIWQSEVSVMSRGSTANIDPDVIFTGWLLDRDGIVYQPGDHVSVRWPRTMIFTAQWAIAEDVIHLRYHPNGASPEGCYPNEIGFNFRKNATAVVWDNTHSNGSVWYHRPGYTFTGWNTKPDGSGTAYSPDANIRLYDPVTTLYAQWRKDTHEFTLHKEDWESGISLPGAQFDLYKLEDGQFLLVESQTSGVDGVISFSAVETLTLYKLVEDRPPDGYAIMTREICFRLAPGETAVTLEFCDSEGNEIAAPMGVTGEYISGSHHLMFTVANVAGFELPATGGVGPLLYMLFGVILTFAPLVYCFGLRRRQEGRAEK